MPSMQPSMCAWKPEDDACANPLLAHRLGRAAKRRHRRLAANDLHAYGRPVLVKPHGTEIEGKPLTLNGDVLRTTGKISSALGSEIAAGGMGSVGVTSASTDSNDFPAVRRS